jgi:uncharacterized protein
MVIAVVQDLVKNQKIPAQNIFIYGHSLGGAIAVDLAKRHPNIAGLIVEGSFTSIKDMLDYRITWQIFPQAWIVTQHFDSLSKVQSIRVPLLIIHGTADQVVPLEMSQTLLSASSSPQKSLFLVPAADHNNIAEVGGENYRQAISSFITRHHNVK